MQSNLLNLQFLTQEKLCHTQQPIKSAVNCVQLGYGSCHSPPEAAFLPLVIVASLFPRGQENKALMQLSTIRQPLWLGGKG